jgi:hypothetical protein
MYDRLTNQNQLVYPAQSSTRDQHVGYNYSDYSEFAPPNTIQQSNIVNGETQREYKDTSFTPRQIEANRVFIQDAVMPYASSPNL